MPSKAGFEDLRERWKGSVCWLKTWAVAREAAVRKNEAVIFMFDMFEVCSGS